MPIQPMSINDYSKIPDAEDVTRLDNSIKKTKKSSKWIFAGVILIVTLYLIYHFNVHPSSIITPVKTVKIYSTSQARIKKHGGLNRIDLDEINEIDKSDLRSVSFGNGKDCNSQGHLIAIQVPGSPSVVEVCSNDASFTPAIMSISGSKKYQKIVGFGGAFTEASANNFYMLPKESQEQIIELYFGKTGIGFTLGRVAINSCDFSPESYNFDDIKDDFNLAFFDDEVTHDQINIIPMIQEAIEASGNTLQILASPWSPPAWMKKPLDGKTSMLGSVWPNGLREEPKYRTAWAQYISKWITAYKNKGVPIWAITPQNEPEFPAPWEACAYNETGERDFINGYLGPTLDSVHPEVLILAFDHNKDHLLSWAQTIMGGDKGNYVDGMAFHWYGDLDRLTDGTYGYNELNATYHYAPDKMLLATEGCSCPGIEVDDWLRAERLAHDVMYDLKNYVQGWIDWNLLVNSEGGFNHLGNNCDASMFCKSDYSGFHLQPKYYYFGHISKFVSAGAIRVKSSIVGNYAYSTDVDPNVQGNLEIGLFPCERSTRQMWKLNENRTIELSTKVMYTLDKEHGPHNVRFCVTQGDGRRKGYLKLTDCTYHDKFTHFVNVKPSKDGQLVDDETGMCITMADGVMEEAALMYLAPCISVKNKAEITPNKLEKGHSSDINSQVFSVDTKTGEILALNVDNLCMTAGWPFLSAVAFRHEKNGQEETVAVVLNEANTATSILLFDSAKDSKPMAFAIEGKSMQTIVY